MVSVQWPCRTKMPFCSVKSSFTPVSILFCSCLLGPLNSERTGTLEGINDLGRRKGVELVLEA